MAIAILVDGDSFDPKKIIGELQSLIVEAQKGQVKKQKCTMNNESFKT